MAEPTAKHKKTTHIRIKNWNRQKLRKKLDDALERMDNTTRKGS
jgi:hypothetical protein